MLTRLEIDGFKTFEKLEIGLAPFTQVLGALGEQVNLDRLRMLPGFVAMEAELVRALEAVKVLN